MAVHWGGRGPGHMSRNTALNSFTPLSLFAASEPGFWYDPSDFSTLFQDSAGTTPVTAVGQSVGLVLDKRLGLVLGSDLAVNGDFSSGTGWTTAAGVSIGGGVATFTAVTNSSALYRSASVAIGTWYEVTVVVSSMTAGTLQPRLFGGAVAPNIISAAGTYTFRDVVTTVNTNIGFIANGASGVVESISVKELPGNHAYQATAGSRPVLRQNGALYYLEFDGTDDFLVTGTITPGVDKAQVFVGLTKASDAAIGAVLGLTSAPTINAAIELLAPLSVVGDYRWQSSGSNQVTTPVSGFVAPITNVVTGLGDIAADTAIIRANGTQVGSNATDQGTGNYAAGAVYIGRRGGTVLPFNGHIYSMIVRFGANLTADQISAAEGYVAGKTGVVL